MVRINLIGTLFGTSGYAIHLRRLFNALVELGVEVSLDVPLVQGWELLVTDSELNAIQKEHFNDGVSVMISQPVFWGAGLVEPCAGFVGYCVWEGDKVPTRFLENLRKADAVVVPSAHVRDAVLNTDKEVRNISVVPHGVDLDLFVPQEKSDGRFVFVANKGWCDGEFDRGGLQFLLRAFSEEFSKGEDVVLKVKVNPAYNRPGWDVGEEIRKLGLPDDRPEIHINAVGMDYRSLPGFYSGDCFVSSTMGEAFSIPCLEALACGLPVLTTGFGGQVDFVKDGVNGWHVPYSLVENVWHWEYEGIKWAVPDKDVLRRLLREIFESRGDHEKWEKMRLTARETASRLSWRNSAACLVRVCEDIIQNNRKV